MVVGGWPVSPMDVTRSTSALVAISTSVSLASRLPRGFTPGMLLKVPPASTASARSGLAIGGSFTGCRTICRLSWSTSASCGFSPGMPSPSASPKLPRSLVRTVRVSMPLKLRLPR
ncbi:hypothetical protein D9M72_654610 [compost metagenome]